MWVGVRTEVMRGWIGEMRLSARNGKRVDRRNEGGSEKNEWIRVRNGKRKLNLSIDWIGAWIVSVECIGVDRSVDWIGAWIVLCVEWIRACLWIRACFIECVEWIGACLWIGACFVE